MSEKEQCFVIQPFDGAEFDRRYNEILVPAIEAAGLKDYRVDRDPGAHVPIESIERGIRNSAAVLADITEDRPNVWYEVGYAFAHSHSVVLVCRKDARQRGFPFDIQHRNVTTYEVGSRGDLDAFESAVVERLKAVTREARLSRTLQESPIALQSGLKPHEVATLVTTAGQQMMSGQGVAEWEVRRAVSNIGFNELAIALAVRRLVALGFLIAVEVEGERGEPYPGLRVRSAGFDWLENNQDQLTLRLDPDSMSRNSFNTDDIPF